MLPSGEGERKEFSAQNMLWIQQHDLSFFHDAIYCKSNMVAYSEHLGVGAKTKQDKKKKTKAPKWSML